MRLGLDGEHIRKYVAHPEIATRLWLVRRRLSRAVLFRNFRTGIKYVSKCDVYGVSREF